MPLDPDRLRHVTAVAHRYVDDGRFPHSVVALTQLVPSGAYPIRRQLRATVDGALVDGLVPKLRCSVIVWVTQRRQTGRMGTIDAFRATT